MKGVSQLSLEIKKRANGRSKNSSSEKKDMCNTEQVKDKKSASQQ